MDSTAQDWKIALDVRDGYLYLSREVFFQITGNAPHYYLHNPIPCPLLPITDVEARLAGISLYLNPSYDPYDEDMYIHMYVKVKVPWTLSNFAHHILFMRVLTCM